MSRSAFRSAYDAGACTPQQVLDFHLATFGGLRMEDTGSGDGGQGEGQAGERPSGVSDAEWEALGDPGKQALVRERARATKAEQDLAAVRAAKKTPPKPAPPKGKAGEKPGPETDDEPTTPDVTAIIKAAVAEAVAPFQAREEEREAEEAARRIAEALTKEASPRLVDSSDALTNIDLTTLTDGAGRPDAAKIKSAVDDLVARKPHLAKATDGRRHADPDEPVGGHSGSKPLEARVKESLARMQAAAGVKFVAGDD